MNGKWLSILEYANYKNKSISTVRRYVKSGKVETREENGKYFIYVKNYQDSSDHNHKLQELVDQLEHENKRLKNELNEANMLIDLYEQGKFLNTNTNPPEAPVIL